MLDSCLPHLPPLGAVCVCGVGKTTDPLQGIGGCEARREEPSIRREMEEPEEPVPFAMCPISQSPSHSERNLPTHCL
jgi:hypothetical protein